MTKSELVLALKEQVSDSFIAGVGSIVMERLFERLPGYYVGGKQGLFENIQRRLGGQFSTDFPLGFAGFSSGVFYISYSHCHSYDGMQILKSDEFLEETMLFENHYVDLIVDGLYGLCEEYLVSYG
ncbi:hypothetical protein EII38_04515 [Streptococcus minor]|uniref:Uncharacterized protein n=1 Tax=Streptococcus minor TaxID=229549 RepID=A0A3P1VGI0_9STRE|nr:hypothetical protein [Streptococcus minor]RRD31493.1 hypothetical protein EII38_04515 [Streptococcus minor]